MGIDSTGSGSSSSSTSSNDSYSIAARAMQLQPLKDETVPREELPNCPKCKTSLLRPGVVWFGESLPVDTIDAIDTWIEAAPKIDLVLVIGTTAKVYPAAGYIDVARRKGARVAVVNMESEDLGATGPLREGDWMFEGDAGVIVPKIFESVIGTWEIEKGRKDA
jgi:NAD-dependent deacetylase sirtuin 5